MNEPESYLFPMGDDSVGFEKCPLNFVNDVKMCSCSYTLDLGRIWEKIRQTEEQVQIP